MIDFFEVMLLYHRAINLKWQYNYFLISKQVMSGVASEISSKNYKSTRDHGITSQSALFLKIAYLQCFSFIYP